MTEPPDKWPDWQKPATKGDVLRGMIKSQSALVGIVAALAASVGDRENFREKMDEAFRRLEKLSNEIDAIGGEDVPDDD